MMTEKYALLKCSWVIQYNQEGKNYVIMDEDYRHPEKYRILTLKKG